jgi:hypothetical protein
MGIQCVLHPHLAYVAQRNCCSFLAVGLNDWMNWCGIGTPANATARQVAVDGRQMMANISPKEL